jgi:hypothetical protein
MEREMSDRIDYHQAPRPLKQKMVPLVGTVLVLGMAMYLLCRFRVPYLSPSWNTLFGCIPFVLVQILLICPQTVRGYQLLNRSLIVKRFWWPKQIELCGLQSAIFTPIEGLDLKGSMARTMGFAKWLDGNTVGTYQLFLTNPSKAVVLKFTDHTVVVTPDQPEQFAQDVLKYASMNG